MTLLLEEEQHGVGISPMPICRVAPSSIRSATCAPIDRDTSLICEAMVSSTGSRSISTTWRAC